MERRTFLQTTAAAAALAALPMAASALTNTPMKKSRRTILGHDMAYVDQGRGRPVVFLHGNRSEEHTSELQSRRNLVCRLLLEKKNHITTCSQSS